MPDRLFVAIWPPVEEVDALAARLERTRGGPGDGGDGVLRWQSPERWHVTLAFLGNRSADVTTSRLHHLSFAAASPVRLKGAGTFGPILWVGVEDGAGLDDLALHVQRHLDAADKRFRAHVTIARGRGRNAPAGAARAVAAEIADYAGRLWTPKEITLVASRTGPHPEYTIVGRWSLPPG